MNEHRTAIVTGASRGIGRSVAEILSRDGMNVVVNYLHSEKEALELADTLAQGRRAAIPFRADVASLREVTAMVDEATRQFGRVDVLVNNAGAIYRPGDWINIDDETWNRTLEVNLKGAFNCLRALGERMRDQGYGRVVNVTSTYAIMGATAVIAYTAAKAGVTNLTRSFAKELAPFVTVNEVVAGNIDTDMTAGAGADFNASVIAATPLRRLGSPSDVAEAIAFLTSDRAAFITGASLTVDGGHVL